MPLPTRSMAWPPAQLTPIARKLCEWDAWFIGSAEELTRVYQARGAQTATRTGGVSGFLRRLWWGREVSGSAQRPDGLHVPVAADLARISADLLYAEPPTLTAAPAKPAPVADDAAPVSNPTQDRLDLYVDDSFHDVLATGAEVGAALGGRYHVVAWDKTLSERPFLTTVDADNAWPEFRFGRLVAVTFWWVVERNGGQVLRHLERHELDQQGNGLVFHGLYDGTGDTLGTPLDLTRHSSTEALAAEVAEDGAMREGRTPGLCVAYIPNQTPNRIWRKDPVGKSLGRSDFDGVETLMDALDEAYSSLMRDVRLGKARIIVPTSMLESNGLGKGAAFDLDREVYEGVNAPPTEDGKQEITPQQFEIRFEEHLAICEDLVKRIVSTAGYSTQSLGDITDGGAITATEVHSRERKTYSTRDRKIRHERPAVKDLVHKMLAIDAAVFKTPSLDLGATIDVTFADTVQDSAISMAQTAMALRQAQAASTHTLVEMNHPDWDPEQVAEEVSRIMAETPAPLGDPFAVTE